MSVEEVHGALMVCVYLGLHHEQEVLKEEVNRKKRERDQLSLQVCHLILPLKVHIVAIDHAPMITGRAYNVYTSMIKSVLCILLTLQLSEAEDQRQTCTHELTNCVLQV